MTAILRSGGKTIENNAGSTRYCSCGAPVDPGYVACSNCIMQTARNSNGKISLDSARLLARDQTREQGLIRDEHEIVTRRGGDAQAIPAVNVEANPDQAIPVISVYDGGNKVG